MNSDCQNEQIKAKCECHSCTQSRMSSLERAIYEHPQKSDSFQTPEKKEHICDCEFCGHHDTIHIPAMKKECDHPFAALWAKKLKEEGILECSMCDARLYVPIKSPAPDKTSATDAGTLVEEKIKSVSGLMTRTYEQGYVSRIEIENELKALITLARRQK